MSLIGSQSNYADMIYSPDDETLGMGERGKDLGKDIAGMIAYVDILVSGDSKAVKVKDKDNKPVPLGTKYFLKTFLKCKNEDNKEVDRYIYINNVPTGYVLGAKTNMKGLAPGIVANMEKMSPLDAIENIFQQDVSACQKVTLHVRNDTDTYNDRNRTETHYVTVGDLKDLIRRNEHINEFTGKPMLKEEKESITNINVESFSLYNDNNYDTIILKIYFLGTCLLSIYIIFKLLYK